MATRTLCKGLQTAIFPRFSSEIIPCLVRSCSDKLFFDEEEVFREYEIRGLNRQSKKGHVIKRKTARKYITRNEKTSLPSIDWTNVWPAAQSFKHSVVPLPVRQGYVEGVHENKGYVPDKLYNVELMKIPNFLHLTPVHIKKHCKAIKRYCTEFPENLMLAKKTHLKTLFPVEVIESDYCFAGPSLRDERARTITIKVNMASLKLDDHARDKMIRLLGHRYDKELDEFTITTDSCPTKRQNYDHAMYLLTVLYHESKITEPWEEEKTVDDMLQYFWNINKSKENIIKLLQRIKESDVSKSLKYLPDDTSEEKLLEVKEVEKYKDSIENLMNNGENSDNLEQYKQSVLDLLNLKETSPQSTPLA